MSSSVEVPLSHEKGEDRKSFYGRNRWFIGIALHLSSPFEALSGRQRVELSAVNSYGELSQSWSAHIPLVDMLLFVKEVWERYIYVKDGRYIFLMVDGEEFDYLGKGLASIVGVGLNTPDVILEWDNAPDGLVDPDLSQDGHRFAGVYIYSLPGKQYGWANDIRSEFFRLTQALEE